jgi:acyl-CoA thioesterase FadM
LEVATWVSDVRRTNAVRHSSLTRLDDGGLVARAHSYYAWVDIATGRPIRIPAQFLQDFAANIVP